MLGKLLLLVILALVAYGAYRFFGSKEGRRTIERMRETTERTFQKGKEAVESTVDKKVAPVRKHAEEVEKAK